MSNRANLPLVCLGVLLASSPWFSGTAVVPQVLAERGLEEASAARMTGVVQFGFIFGTLLFALTNLADRFDARSVFALSALGAAAANLGFAHGADSWSAILAARFITGVCLAGVYPVAMAIVAARSPEGLGWKLGLLVGALTLGTGAPYLLRALAAEADWRTLVDVASGAALVGALVVRVGVSEGPRRSARPPFRPKAMLEAFGVKGYRAAALGYFGHMWELYALWGLSGYWLHAALADEGPAWTERVPALSFAILAFGAAGCVLGGLASRRLGERKVASVAMLGSGVCCVLAIVSPGMPAWGVVGLCAVWGLFVVADSAQFSALAASTCPPEYRATALTIQNGIGFAITIVSLELLPRLAAAWTWPSAMAVLALGPLFGLVALRPAPARALTSAPDPAPR